MFVTEKYLTLQLNFDRNKVLNGNSLSKVLNVNGKKTQKNGVKHIENITSNKQQQQIPYIVTKVQLFKSFHTADSAYSSPVMRRRTYIHPAMIS